MPIPFIAMGAAAVGRRLFGGAIVRGAGRLIGRVAASRAGRFAGTLAAGAATTAVANRFSQPVLMPPPGFGPPQGGGGPPMPRPKEGRIGRTISQVLPGGMTGREFTPYGDMTDNVGRPIAVYPEEIAVTRGPRGYAMVTLPNGDRVAMQTRFAVKAGLYTPAPKPPVSGRDMAAIRRASSAKKRVKKLAQKVGWSCKGAKACR